MQINPLLGIPDPTPEEIEILKQGPPSCEEMMAIESRLIASLEQLPNGQRDYLMKTTSDGMARANEYPESQPVIVPEK